jgi:hypothetical protein
MFIKIARIDKKNAPLPTGTTIAPFHRNMANDPVPDQP